MTQDQLYTKASEQALKIAYENGCIAPYFLAIGLLIFLFGCYMCALDGKSIQKSYLGRALIGCLLGPILFLAGLQGLYDARQAKHNPELFLLKNLNHPETRFVPLTYPIISK